MAEPNRESSDADFDRAGGVEIEVMDHARCVVRPMLPVLDGFAQEVYRTHGPESVGWGDGGVAFPAGSVAAVVRILEESRRRCRVRDRRMVEPDAVPNEAFRAAAGGAERRFLDALADNRLGLLELGRAVHPFGRIEQVYRLFPDARVVVAVRDPAEVGGYVRGLAEWLDERVGWVTATRAATGPRLVVVRAETVGAWSPPAPAVLIVPDADRDPAAAYRAVRAFRRCARAFGFAGAVHGATGAALTAAFGEVAFTPAAGGSGVQVFVVKSPPVPMPRTRTMLAFKRAAFWRNKPRLRVAAGIARAARSGDTGRLREYGLRFDAAELPATPTDRRVLVLVENLDQGKRLQRLLPDWPLLAGSSPAGEKARADQEGRAIATVTAAARTTITADVLVRATGGWGEIQVKGFPPVVFFAREWEAVVIDFADDWHPRARRLAQYRQRDYRRMGYAVTPC